MENIFADRISDVPRSFIREILKVTATPEIISFAGGLPNRDYFPIDGIREACARIFDGDEKEILQYSTTEGYPLLRGFISDRYAKKKGLDVDPESIIITSGSQQGLDLIGKTLLNEGDSIIIEKPGYLGAIQAFSIYKARFHPVPVLDDGPDMDALGEILSKNRIKLYYAVPNFQNPAGISYSDEKRRAVAGLMERHNVLFVEDDPYGELRFLGEDLPSVRKYLPENTIMLGSFSKIVAPAFRLGWLSARSDIMEKIIVAKQASDLHTNYFSQRVVYRYLMDNDIDAHIAAIRKAYGSQRNAMVEGLGRRMPADFSFTLPEGGMFLWARLPEGRSSMELFDFAIGEKVAFVPGNPFYAFDPEPNTMRLNFTNSDEGTIDEGIKRLAKAYEKYIHSNK
ncbi:MAG: PLP-dependent aminotransferase family protein [Spirochaetes bacterium]|jgi:2-aminoadipate transaminase|nr:PLP-dependent aminotransferase family protein [Spirochaetota bacterium]